MTESTDVTDLASLAGSIANPADDNMPTFHCPLPSATEQKTQGTPPDVTTITTITQTVQESKAYPTKTYLGKYCVPDVPLDSQVMKDLLNGASLGGNGEQALEAVGGVVKAWPVVAGACGLALILCFCYLLFLRCCAQILIYVALVSLTLGFGAVGAALLSTSQDWTGNQDKSPLFQRLPYDDAVLYSEIGAGVAFLGFFMFAGILVCCHDKIQQALGCVEAACQVMFSELDLLVAPILDVALRLCTFVVLIGGLIYLVSVGDVTADNEATIGGTKVAGVSRSVTYTEEEQYMLAFYVFGCFWVMETLNALAQFVVSYMVVLWYYTQKDANGNKKMVFCALLKGYGASLCHLGSICFGAFLIATLRVIRLFLEAIAQQSKAQGNAALACVAQALACCVDCFTRFMEFINKMAYVDVAISSNSFCVAGKHSFEFLLKEAPSVALLNGACFVFFWAGVGLVSSISGYGGYLVVSTMTEYTDNNSEKFVAYPEAVGGVCALCALIISLCFMNVFDQAADTLLYCYAWNKKQDPQGVHFYAPDTLAKLADK